MMRKVILSMMVSVDGFIEGPDKNLDWHVWNDEMGQHMHDFFNRVDTILLGRKTFDLFSAYWPTASEPVDDPVITEKMNNLPKVVFSQSLQNTTWNNTKIERENISRAIPDMKKQPGKDLVIFGGAELAADCMRHGLIDEYFLIINPVVLGGGKPLFFQLQMKFDLKLIDSKKFTSGNMLLQYKNQL